ncbi:MAG: hypothetical protein A2283_10850 [Lentisphaerae bacterium RIFOXYA12_FULL_48_11]|nr:MAG: hypothetical protein A2283_10850 [Lentisphaerae bacterium RIFOXYA12_FULL_48_11]
MKFSFSLGKANWRTQFTVAYAAMAIIPLLTFGYFLVAYLLPEHNTRENLLLVIAFSVMLSLAGFSILIRNINTLAGFCTYIENVARGSLNKQLISRNGPEEARINESMEKIIEKLEQDRERLAAFTQNLEVEVASRTNELKEDIERRKRTEQALRESNMMLSDALTELKEMEHRLVVEEKMSALGQMASSVAHDFNNALMPVIGLTEFLLMNRNKLDDRQEVISTLEDIHDSADRAREAVGRLREFYKMDGSAEYDLVDVNMIFEKAINSFSDLLQKKLENNIVIEIRRDLFDLPLINADESELREAIRNVIVNSIEAMPEGGVITCRSRMEGKHVALEITDTGEGMTLDVQGRCMDPFFTTKPGHKNGIGLAVVYGIARRHHGNLEISSDLGKGTIVKIILPLVKVSSSETASSFRIGGTSGQLKILLIDDDASSRNILSRYLNATGFVVKSADSGVKGLEAFAEDKYDLVITDRAMPDMSGDIVAASIRKGNVKIPIIMLTGFGELMKNKHEKPDGVDRILSKPVSLKELRCAVDEVTGAFALK